MVGCAPGEGSGQVPTHSCPPQGSAQAREPCKSRPPGCICHSCFTLWVGSPDLASYNPPFGQPNLLGCPGQRTHIGPSPEHLLGTGTSKPVAPGLAPV